MFFYLQASPPNDLFVPVTKLFSLFYQYKNCRITQKFEKWKNWLPGLDSNQRPCGYKYPLCFHKAWTISFPLLILAVRNWALHPILNRITSFRNSLCTLSPKATLAQDYHSDSLTLGFPELTQFFNRNFLRKLRFHSRMLYH